jgi:hypothetical protein
MLGHREQMRQRRFGHHRFVVPQQRAPTGRRGTERVHLHAHGQVLLQDRHPAYPLGHPGPSNVHSGLTGTGGAPVGLAHRLLADLLAALLRREHLRVAHHHAEHPQVGQVRVGRQPLGHGVAVPDEHRLQVRAVHVDRYPHGRHLRPVLDVDVLEHQLPQRPLPLGGQPRRSPPQQVPVGLGTGEHQQLPPRPAQPGAGDSARGKQVGVAQSNVDGRIEGVLLGEDQAVRRVRVQVEVQQQQPGGRRYRHDGGAAAQHPVRGAGVRRAVPGRLPLADVMEARPPAGVHELGPAWADLGGEERLLGGVVDGGQRGAGHGRAAGEGGQRDEAGPHDWQGTGGALRIRPPETPSRRGVRGTRRSGPPAGKGRAGNFAAGTARLFTLFNDPAPAAVAAGAGSGRRWIRPRACGPGCCPARS